MERQNISPDIYDVLKDIYVQFLNDRVPFCKLIFQLDKQAKPVSMETIWYVPQPDPRFDPTYR